MLTNMSDIKQLALKNIKKPIKKVKHQDLTRFNPENSIFKSICPVCKKGILLVGRDQMTFDILTNDVCVLCGQRFIYIDIEKGHIDLVYKEA